MLFFDPSGQFIKIIHNVSILDLGPSQVQKLYIDLWVETRNNINIMILRPGHINQKAVIYKRDNINDDGLISK